MDIEDLRSKLDAKTPIEGVTFTEFDWGDLDAEGARFGNCLIERGQFSNVVFTGAKFSRCRFHHCRFARAELTEAEFEDCSFTVRDDPPSGCTFMFCDLRRTRFSKCDASFCEFERSDLFSVEMDQCDLRGARFHKVYFSQSFSREVLVTRAAFRNCNLDFADLAAARLAECDFTGSRLREADLNSADLTNAILRDCDLFKAELAGAKLAGADLRGAEISGLNLLSLADFSGMKISQSQQHVLLLGLGVDVWPDAG